MNTLFLGKHIIELDVVDSTNNYAANLISTSNVHEGTVIMAHYQSYGKGQMGNIWHTEPSKNLTFSMILFPNMLSINSCFLLSKIVALAVKNTLENFLSAHVVIKWPNDILINNKKIAGILIENQWHNNKLRAIVGIGLNINQVYFDKNMNATSCAIIAQREWDIKWVMQNVIEQIEREYLKLKSGFFEDINLRYLESLLYFNESKPYTIGNKILNATIESVLLDGKLQMRLVDGSVAFFSFKEIGFIY